MARSFMPLRRSAALSVAITLFAAPVVAAQSPDAIPSSAVPAKGSLLSSAAFARLMQPPPADVAATPAVADAPRSSLVRQSTAATTRQAARTSTQPSRQSSVGWGKKTLGVLLVVGALVGLAAASYYTGVDFGDLMNGVFGSGK